ncbi:16S rRNA (cytosine(1402)-N(4))-methyltransferase RsmH [soil metagenome]
MAANDGKHTSVLLEDSIDALRIKADGIYVDGTFGRGGHSRALLERLADAGAGGLLIAFDKDPEAIAVGRQLQAEFAERGGPRFEIVHASFATLDRALDERDLPFVDGVLFDLGVSSPQLDDAERGFSFRRDGPLDMRMDPTRGVSAADFVNTAAETALSKVIRDYGEERFAVSVAKAIVARRARTVFSRTLDLAQVVAGAVKTREKGHDPATRTFQALRIFVNQELEELPIALDIAASRLRAGGRLVVISFHSLEDRIVKRFMSDASRMPAEYARLPLRESQMPAMRLADVARVLPDDADIEANPRARSAVMRSATRTQAPWSAA